MCPWLFCRKRCGKKGHAMSGTRFAVSPGWGTGGLGWNGNGFSAWTGPALPQNWKPWQGVQRSRALCRTGQNLSTTFLTLLLLKIKWQNSLKRKLAASPCLSCRLSQWPARRLTREKRNARNAGKDASCLPDLSAARSLRPLRSRHACHERDKGGLPSLSAKALSRRCREGVQLGGIASP